MAPDWTPALVDRFVQAYYDGRASMKRACQSTGVPFRAAVRHREENADFADRLAWTDSLYRDSVREEFQRRVMDDPSRPANIIFDLKSRDADYKPASGNNQVKVNIAFVDKAFGATQALAALPERKMLVEPVIEAETSPEGAPSLVQMVPA